MFWRLLDMRLIIGNSSKKRTHGIIVNYTVSLKAGSASISRHKQHTQIKLVSGSNKKYNDQDTSEFAYVACTYVSVDIVRTSLKNTCFLSSSRCRFGIFYVHFVPGRLSGLPSFCYNCWRRKRCIFCCWDGFVLCLFFQKSWCFLRRRWWYILFEGGLAILGLAKRMQTS